MAVADIPADQIVNERSSYEQYLWRLAGSQFYRWDSRTDYMYRIGATPVAGQGLPPGPPVPPLPAPFSSAQTMYLDGRFVRTVNGRPVDANGNIDIPVLSSARQVIAGTGLTGGGDLSADRTFSLTPASIASLAKADSASQPNHTHTAAQISDASVQGRAILTTGDYTTIRNNLLAAPWIGTTVGAGTGLTGGGDLSANRTLGLNAASIASLLKADSSSQPGHKHAGTDITDSTVLGRSILGAADQATARNALAVPSWSTAFTAGTGLTGGGDLTTSRTLGLNAATIASLAKADSAVQAAAIADLANGGRLGKISQNISGTDLNAFVVNGWGAGNNLTNSPDGSTAFFYVKNHVNQAADNYFQQTGTKYGQGTNSGETWVRYAEGAGVYTPWVKIADAQGALDPTARAALAVGARLGIYGQDVSNQDANAIVTNGFYRGQNMTNVPIPVDWFYILVESHDGSNWVKQTVTCYGVLNDANVGTWYRERRNGTWGAWIKIADIAGAVDPTARTSAGNKYTKPGTGIPDADLASKFVKTVNGTAPDAAGNVAVATGGGAGAVSSVNTKTGAVVLSATDVGAAAQRTIPGANTAMWTRILTIDGKSGTEGANAEVLISGLGVYGTAARATLIVQFAQRNSWTPVLKVWKWGSNSDADTGAIAFSQISEFVTELWYSGPAYTFDSTVTILSGHNYTVSMTQQAAAPATPIIAPYIQMDTSDAVRAVVYAAGAYPARPATSAPVRYIGPVQPTTWLPNDEWVNNA